MARAVLLQMSMFSNGGVPGSIAQAIAAQSLAGLLFIVPTTTDRGWQTLKYRNIPHNLVVFSEQGIEIRVNRSASPLVYPLPTPVRVRGLRARGQMTGRLNVTAEQQGARGFDDYALRLGLVEVGPRRLGRFERWLAPEWMRQLFRLAPPDTGIAQVRLFNLGIDRTRVGQRRRHPLNDLLLEEIVAAPATGGRFDFSVSFDEPVEAIALWISADGDDTGATYVVRLEAIELQSI